MYASFLLQLALSRNIMDICKLLLYYLYSRLSTRRTWKNLRNKWVLISDATSGLGTALSRELAARGHNLVIAGVNKASLTKLARELGARVRVTCLLLDSFSGAYHNVLESYNIGLFINVLPAPGTHPQAFVDSETEQFLETQVSEVFKLVKAVLHIFTRNNFGYILTVGSSFSNKPHAYFSMRHGLQGLFKHWTESMYYELKRSKINVEYMEVGETAGDEAEATYFVPSAARLSQSILNAFGSSYFMVPYFPHIMTYALLSLCPKGLVARYRTACLDVDDARYLKGL